MPKASLFDSQELTDQQGPVRFGIAEWYGDSFVHISQAERKKHATFTPNEKARMSAAARRRMSFLLARQQTGATLTPAEKKLLSELTAIKLTEIQTNRLCPARGTMATDICTKKGGVCSLREYESKGAGVTSSEGAGVIRALCPSRFYEGGEIFRWVGSELLGDASPGIVREVGFLESTSGDTEDSADVGRLDMILVKDVAKSNEMPMQWCALEIQAVYFSGRSMESEFASIAEHAASGIPFPNAVRRPDYRSSGPKRLMPQLQIKVPTLRRWGKKMAVVVDRAFFASLGAMQPVSDVSNSDIGWFIVDFAYSPEKKRYTLVRDKVVYTTLEDSVQGLTGGRPIPMRDFEKRIIEKLTRT
jgi:hypothetical protein